MFFQKILEWAREWAKEELTPEDLNFLISNVIHFARKFKYLGCLSTPLLNKEAKIEMRIKNLFPFWHHKTLLWLQRHWYPHKIPNIHCWPYNTCLWGFECWNVTDQVHYDYITIRKVRFWCCNIANIHSFSIRRTTCYIGNVSWSPKNSYPWLFRMLGLINPGKMMPLSYHATITLWKLLNMYFPMAHQTSKQYWKNGIQLPEMTDDDGIMMMSAMSIMRMNRSSLKTLKIMGMMQDWNTRTHVKRHNTNLLCTPNTEP